MTPHQFKNFGLQERLSPEDGRSHEYFTLRERIITHSTFCEATREIARLHERWIESKVAEGLMLVGQTGSGKSTVLKHYERHFPREEDKSGTKIPVLRVITPEKPTVKTLAESILLGMGDPAAMQGTAQMKTTRIVHLFKACGVNILLLDEFQHFSEGRRTVEAIRVTDWLKNLINIVHIPIVLVGLPRSISVLKLNPQLRRRFSAPLYLRPFEFETQQQKIEFRSILQTFQRLLPVKCLDMHEPNMARRFFVASNGLIDYLVKLIDDAASRGGSGPDESLVLKDFHTAFKRTIWSHPPEELNPFSQVSVLRPLTRQGEPFDVWDPLENYINDRPSKPYAQTKATKGAQ